MKYNKLILILTITMILLASTSLAVLNNANKYFSTDNADISGTTVIDLTGTRNMTLVNGVLTNKTGIIEEAIRFDGDNDYSSVLNHGFTDDMTVSFWINASSSQPQLYPALFSAGTNKYFHIRLKIDPANVISFYTGNTIGWDTACDGTANLQDDTYHHLVFKVDGSGNRREIWIDGVSHKNCTTGVGYTASTDDFYLGDRYDHVANNNYNGTIDEFGIYPRLLSKSEIQTLYNSGSGYNPYNVTVNSSIDFFFMNDSNQWNFPASKTTFDEGEDFYVYLNWTNVTGQIKGECNITMEGAISPIDFNDTEIILCGGVGGGCQGNSYTENLNQTSNISVKQDFIHFKVCHNSQSKQDLNVSIDCNGNSNYTIINQINIPLCSVGAINFDVYMNNCNNFTNANITFSNNAPSFGHGHNITDANWDREFYIENQIWGIDVFRNVTNGIYYVNHSHEYYEHGLKTINASCSNSTLGLSKFDTTQITIVNRPPQIVFENLITPCYQSPLVNDATYEFCSGQWNFSILIIDDDADKINTTLQCQNAVTGTLTTIESFYGNYSPSVRFEVNSSKFVDFADPLNQKVNCSWNIFVNDTGGLNDTGQLNYTVNDTINPVCIGINNQTIGNNTNLTWNIQCLDEHFYSFNVTCTGGSSYSFFKQNINATSYNFINQTLITSNTSCLFDWCDGHTSDKLKRVKDPEKTDKGIKFNIDDYDYYINYTGVRDFNFTFEKKYDRYSFKFTDHSKCDTKDKSKKCDDKSLTTYNFKINTIQGDYINNPKYPGWIVDYQSRIWLDFANDVNAGVSVTPLGNGIFNVMVVSSENEIEFNSIGELNCKNQTQIIDIVPLIITPTLETGVCPDSTFSSMNYGWAIIMCLVFFGFGIFSRYRIFRVLASFMLIFIGFIYVGCNVALGYMLIMISIVLIVWSLVTLIPSGRDPVFKSF